ncbi:aldo/keto reductase [Maritimibacter alkaliphilus]|uniref:aldo/keto reductase n=1 Tax=Maritimibacter alkaliphilus TaxID=404236 RepID=UPI0021BDCF55|nr:aldo/keto reductase [Maritimibacter alkaliphilus]
MSKPAIPVIEANGASIPQIGLGTWELQGDVLAGSVEAALAAGYRHFDTAKRYENEADLGAALRASDVPRDEMFITTKVWRDDLAEETFLRSAEASVERIGMGPADLLLVHWPSPDRPMAEVIGALCTAQKEGFARHIGVSNFPPRLLREAISLADAPLSANQCEYHPRLDQTELLELCRREGIAFTAYAPIGSGGLLDDPELADLAAETGRTPAQVVLRWHLQQGVVAIPRSRNPERIAQNIAITDFELSDAQMARLSAMARPDGRRFGNDWVDWNA